MPSEKEIPPRVKGGKSEPPDNIGIQRGGWREDGTAYSDSWDEGLQGVHSGLLAHCPLNWAFRFSRKAVMPSFMSSVEASRPNILDSEVRPSVRVPSIP